MALTNIDNSDSGLEVRTALNSMFTELYSARWVLLANSGIAVPHTGDTAETVLATVSVPAGVMGPNGILRITSQWSMPNNGNAKTLRIRLGGLAGTVFFNTAQTTVLSYADPVRTIQNRNSAASQVSRAVSSTAAGSAVATITGTVNTAVAQDLVLTGQCASAADTITLESYQVELMYVP